MSWAGHLACVGTGEGHTGFWYERREGKDHLEELGIVSIILECTF